MNRNVFKMLLAFATIAVGLGLLISTWGSAGQTILATVTIAVGLILLGKTLPRLRKK